jgi:hypothetical protein
MNPMLQQFTAVALPVMITFAVAGWLQSRSVDRAVEGVNASILGIHKRLDDIVGRLDRIEKKLDDHADRIARLEERTSPIGRRP